MVLSNNVGINYNCYELQGYKPTIYYLVQLFLCNEWRLEIYFFIIFLKITY